MPVPRGSAWLPLWPDVAGEPVLCWLLGAWLWAIPVLADAAKRTAARRATYFIILSPCCCCLPITLIVVKRSYVSIQTWRNTLIRIHRSFSEARESARGAIARVFSCSGALRTVFRKGPRWNRVGRRRKERLAT